MPFVKLDTNILNSTLWFEKMCRDVFLTSLLMAEPFETTQEIAQLEVRSLKETGWKVPPGWYGFVPAAGIGILARALVDLENGLQALEQLGSPEKESRSQDYQGRRMVRVDGGFIILNYFKYRERDYTSAERSRRYRESKKRHAVASRANGARSRDITQAEAYKEKEEEKESRCNRSSAVAADSKEEEPLSDAQREAARQFLRDTANSIGKTA